MGNIKAKLLPMLTAASILSKICSWKWFKGQFYTYCFQFLAASSSRGRSSFAIFLSLYQQCSYSLLDGARHCTVDFASNFCRWFIRVLKLIKIIKKPNKHNDLNYVYKHHIPKFNKLKAYLCIAFNLLQFRLINLTII